MIISFGHQLARDLFDDRITGASRKFPADLRGIAGRKLQYLNAVSQLTELASPPGNRLETLRGKLRGFYSIRINDQWRVVFRWKNGAHQVQVIDYHRG